MKLRASGKRIMERCDALARCSETPGALTRVFLSEPSRAANRLVLDWMEQAGMQARVDAIGNVRGRFGPADGPALVLGSHLDTVRDAGRYDGALGVIAAIECVQALAESGARLPFAVEVIGFGDEEGVRFGTTLLGSRALAGTFDAALLARRDACGTSLAEAMRANGLDPERIAESAMRKEDVLAYAELHIEQGPVLESEGLAVGVVSAISGFTRLEAHLCGSAGHAGTVPMALRRDALAGAAECVGVIEAIAAAEPRLVATVGRLEVRPGAINVIAGEASFSVDVRSAEDLVREAAVGEILRRIREIAARRGLRAELRELQSQRAVACAPWLMAQFADAIRGEGLPVRALASGAGHDGLAMSAIADIGMLFVRCKGGVSHHPAESVCMHDAEIAAGVLARFVSDFRLRPA